MSAIYTPSGPAYEYAHLGLTLYPGCSHGCSYCYNSGFKGSCNDRMHPLWSIEADLRLLNIQSNSEPVHLSFVGDIYDEGRENNDFTRDVLELFNKYDQPFQVLTKGGSRAFLDFDLYSAKDRFGATLTFDNDVDSKKWEHGAALPNDRIDNLRIAHDIYKINTWVSLEPVIDPVQTLHLIDLSHQYVDFYYVGKLNHNYEIEKSIDYRKFRVDAEAKLKSYGKEYRIKRDLARWS
jgi:DNA repair photolyase